MKDPLEFPALELVLSIGVGKYDRQPIVSGTADLCR